MVSSSRVCQNLRPQADLAGSIMSRLGNAGAGSQGQPLSGNISRRGRIPSGASSQHLPGTELKKRSFQCLLHSIILLLSVAHVCLDISAAFSFGVVSEDAHVVYSILFWSCDSNCQHFLHCSEALTEDSDLQQELQLGAEAQWVRLASSNVGIAMP